MAIQHRRGNYSNFDPSKLLPGEPAVVQSGDPSASDGKAVYVAFAAGDVKRLATHEDIVTEIEKSTEEVAQDLTEQFTTSIQTYMNKAQGYANDASEAATDAASSAEAAQEAVESLSTDKTLSVTDKPADAKATGDAISDLNGALVANEPYLAKQLFYRKTAEETINVKFDNGGFYIKADGTRTADNTGKYIGSVVYPIPYGAIKIKTNCQHMGTAGHVFFDENMEYISGFNKDLSGAIIPDGAVFVAFSDYNANADHSGKYFTVLFNPELVLIPSEHDAIEALDARIDGIEDITITEETELITTNIDTWADGYVNDQGSSNSNTNYKHTQQIEVNTGDIINVYNGNSVALNKILYVCAYVENVPTQSKGGYNVSLPYEVPESVTKIVLSTQATNMTATVTKTTSATVRVNSEAPRVDTLFASVMSGKNNRFIWNFDVAANGTYTADKELQDICGYRVCLFAKLSGTLTGETRISKAANQTYGGAIGFDGTNLYSYINGNTSTPSRTQPHGITTFKDYVALVVDYHYKGSATVILSTNGGSYTWELSYWRSQYGAIAVSSATALTDCALSYTCEGVSKDTWMYGDSYFSNTGTIRWTGYLVSNDYDNFLLNGYPGRNSITALASLRTDLALNKIPKRIIWCLGMNDTDSNSQPNANWKTALDAVVEICEQYNIELILATIPNVPNESYVNAYKNAYVKASGYRYIPFAAAISADESSTWYDGMLETVSGGGYGIHPTEQGALCLFNCAVSAVPELLW